MANIVEEERDVIEALKKIMTYNFIGKPLTLYLNSKKYSGIVLDETKNTFVLKIDHSVKTFLKPSILIEFKLGERVVKVPAKYIDSLENRILRKVKYRDNSLL